MPERCPSEGTDGNRSLSEAFIEQNALSVKHIVYDRNKAGSL